MGEFSILADGMMTEDKFWQIIQRSFDRCEGDVDEQAEALADELEPLTSEEMVGFEERFYEFHRQAYTWDLWGAAYVIGGGCSDDGFIDFRSRLISRGREWFLRALENPDVLAEFPANLGDGGSEFEEFAYVARRVHEEKLGEMPDYESGPVPDEPAGDPWKEDDEEGMRKRWPKVFAKYWET